MNKTLTKSLNSFLIAATICLGFLPSTHAQQIPLNMDFKWGDNPKFTFAASLKKGRGEIILCQLHLKRHIDRRTKPYDPIAEQILLNLLGR